MCPMAPFHVSDLSPVFVLQVCSWGTGHHCVPRLKPWILGAWLQITVELYFLFCPLLWYYSCAGMLLHQVFQSSKAQNVEGFPLESLSRLTNEENEDTQFPMKKSALPRIARSICGNQGLRWKIWTCYGLQKKGKNSWITEGERLATQWKKKSLPDLHFSWIILFHQPS